MTSVGNKYYNCFFSWDCRRKQQQLAQLICCLLCYKNLYSVDLMAQSSSTSCYKNLYSVDLTAQSNRKKTSSKRKYKNSPHINHEQTDQAMHAVNYISEGSVSHINCGIGQNSWHPLRGLSHSVIIASEKHTMQYNRWVEGVRGISSATHAHSTIWDESINSVHHSGHNQLLDMTICSFHSAN